MEIIQSDKIRMSSEKFQICATSVCYSIKKYLSSQVAKTEAFYQLIYNIISYLLVYQPPQLFGI